MRGAQTFGLDHIRHWLQGSGAHGAVARGDAVAMRTCSHAVRQPKARWFTTWMLRTTVSPLVQLLCSLHDAPMLTPQSVPLLVTSSTATPTKTRRPALCSLGRTSAHKSISASELQGQSHSSDAITTSGASATDVALWQQQRLAPFTHFPL